MTPIISSLIVSCMCILGLVQVEAQPQDTRGRLPLTEGTSFTVAAIDPDLAPGETMPPNTFTLILSSRQGASVSWGSNLETVIEPGEIKIITVPDASPVVHLQGDRPFSVYSYQDLLGNGEQAWHLPMYAWDTVYRPFEWWQDSYSVVGGPVTTTTGRMVIIAGDETSGEIRRRTGSESFTLSAGEVRTITEDTVENGSRDAATDPTGFEVVGDKPFAIVSGHAKGAVLRFPDGLPGTGEYARPASRSRGNMHEAMLPVRYAGTRFVTAPIMYTPTRIRGWRLDEVGIEDDRGDVIRFIALYDSTEIRSVSDSLADHVDTVMQTGDTWYASRVEKATVWTSNKPVLCMQYGKSFGRIISQASAPDQDPSVDAGLPMMQLVPSVDQWVDHALFMAHDETTNFLNVVCTTEHATSITVNGRPLTTTLRKHAIADEGYVAYSGMIDEGPYTVTSTDPDARFCAWTYGSLDGLQLCKIYGSVAGMNLAIECNDSVIVDQIVGQDTILFTYDVLDDGGGCADVAYAYAERCDGGTVMSMGSTITIVRATPTAIVDGNIIVVSRSGRFVRRWFHLDGTTGVDETRTESLSVSPHPVTDILTIRHTENVPITSPVQIVALTGTVARTIAANGQPMLSVDVSDLAPGTYMIITGSTRQLLMVAPK
jgi:hypothetical protein